MSLFFLSSILHCRLSKSVCLFFCLSVDLPLFLRVSLWLTRFVSLSLPLSLSFSIFLSLFSLSLSHSLSLSSSLSFCNSLMSDFFLLLCFKFMLQHTIKANAGFFLPILFLFIFLVCLSQQFGLEPTHAGSHFLHQCWANLNYPIRYSWYAIKRPVSTRVSD